jgi:hypothetical protein
MEVFQIGLWNSRQYFMLLFVSNLTLIVKMLENLINWIRRLVPSLLADLLIINLQEILFLLQPREEMRYVISLNETSITMKTENVQTSVPLRDSLKKEYERYEVAGFTIYAEKLLFDERDEVLALLRTDFDAVMASLCGVDHNIP